LEQTTPTPKRRIEAETVIYTGLFLVQGFFTLRFAPTAFYPVLSLIGKVVALVGLFVLGGMARAEFLKHAGPRGQGSWPLPKELVDTGLYAIVRHPMSLGMMIASAGLMMIAQHWSSYAVGAGLILYLYLAAMQEEILNKEKFGQAYANYMTRVPRINAIAGLIRFVGTRSRA
jgi:protein-S-isoprenylcysteine O-methyltransferase Ste14